MLRLAVTTLCLSSLFSLWAANFQDFDRYQDKVSKAQIEQRLSQFLEKSPDIRKFYSLNDKELRVGDIAHDKFDYILRLCPTSSTSKPSKRSLKGARIAIDPGHFGGEWARLEQRFIYMQSSESQKTYAFDEGTLTYLTALKLKSLLETDGAIVFLTRQGVSQGCIRETFFKWLESHPSYWEGKESLSQLFRNYYNRLDMAERARVINEFNPEITLILHYNASSGVENKPSNAYTTHSNYNLVFIPGSFRKRDLELEEDRYQFLRLLVSSDLEESLLLSKHVTSEFTKVLKVPLIPDTKNEYESNVCIKQDIGIYSRNLYLTRTIQSPLCYGETLIQNNPEEMERLATLDSEIEGIACSKRVLQVARAYYNGIKNYYQKKPLKSTQSSKKATLSKPSKK